MDWQNLMFALDNLASTGTTFSQEQRVALKASLVAFQKDNQFNRVQFWGRIRGIDNDYFIICGIGKDYLKDRQYFYSTNLGQKWILLSEPSDFGLAMELALSSKGRFIGDPTADSETECTADNSDELEEGEQWAFIKEEERLYATVIAINNEAAVVPRGALMKQPTGIVWENKYFSGLLPHQASQYTSYYHLAPCKTLIDKALVGRADYDLTLDFLDPIASDQPLGSWSIQLDAGETFALIRSMVWPGGFGYHLMSTGQYGWFYDGTGKKNWDIPFMILPPPPDARAAIPDFAMWGEDGEGGGGDADFGMAFAKLQYSTSAPMPIDSKTSASKSKTKQ